MTAPATCVHPLTEDQPGLLQSAVEQVTRILRRHSVSLPLTGVILGSGLGNAGNRLISENGIGIPYQEINGLPVPGIAGHAGQLVCGQIGRTPVAMLQGRVHFYEGHPPEAVIFGTRLLIALGIQTLVVTNAAGGINRSFSPGDLMLIRDHLSPLLRRDLLPQGILTGLPLSKVRTRLWPERLRSIAQRQSTPLRLHEGVYAMMPGPCYETPAEVRMLRTLGADAVGMSTIPEALYAAVHGIEVLGISCITNVAAGLSESPLSHGEVTSTASSVEHEFERWIWDVLPRLSPDAR